MTKRIYKAICAAALGVFVVTMLLIMGVLYNYFSSVQQNQLRSETALAAQGAEGMGRAYFDGLNPNDYRVTWIAANGKVLYDSASDTEAMENHLQRQEIQDALATGYGESARYSPTMMKQYLYAAQKLSDGTVLRLSISHNSIFVLLVGMLQPICIVIAVAAVLSFLLASRLSKRIVEPMNKLNLDEPLENEGYEHISAMDGEEALQKFETEKPDLIILDIMMPKLSGTDVCRKLREKSRVPIIMLTAKGEEIDRILGLELGADDYIVKPFSAREVVARV